MIVVYNLRENDSDTMGNFYSTQVFRDGVKEFSRHEQDDPNLYK